MAAHVLTFLRQIIKDCERSGNTDGIEFAIGHTRAGDHLNEAHWRIIRGLARGNDGIALFDFVDVILSFECKDQHVMDILYDMSSVAYRNYSEKNTKQTDHIEEFLPSVEDLMSVEDVTIIRGIHSGNSADAMIAFISKILPQYERIWEQLGSPRTAEEWSTELYAQDSYGTYKWSDVKRAGKFAIKLHPQYMGS